MITLNWRDHVLDGACWCLPEAVMIRPGVMAVQHNDRLGALFGLWAATYIWASDERRVFSRWLPW